MAHLAADLFNLSAQRSRRPRHKLSHTGLNMLPRAWLVLMTCTCLSLDAHLYACLMISRRACQGRPSCMRCIKTAMRHLDDAHEVLWLDVNMERKRHRRRSDLHMHDDRNAISNMS